MKEQKLIYQNSSSPSPKKTGHDKFASNTITKGFFCADNEDHSYIYQGENADQAPNEQQLNLHSEQTTKRRRRRNRKKEVNEQPQDAAELKKEKIQIKNNQKYLQGEPNSDGEISQKQENRNIIKIQDEKKLKTLEVCRKPEDQNCQQIDENFEENAEKMEELSQPIKLMSLKIGNQNQFDVRKFVNKTVDKGYILKTQICRCNMGLKYFWPEFALKFRDDNYNLLYCKKISSKPKSIFIMSFSENFDQNSQDYNGKMKSNTLGNIVNVFGPGLSIKKSNVGTFNEPREILATIVFPTNILMNKPRSFEVFVKQPNVSYKDLDGVSMEEEIPLNLLYGLPNNKSKIKIYSTRQPTWNKATQKYMMNFKGLAQKASIKNFILEEKDNKDTDVLIFGKVLANLFNLQIGPSLSPFVAFAIAMTSFDSRLMCE